MVLESMQHQLQSIYDLNLTCQVNDYLITDRFQAARLDTSQGRRDTTEKLLVCQDQDELQISLYLAEELLSLLSENNPFDCLNAHNLEAFCTALEGVSHFIYLTWNASHDRPVSQLEMELQAEVDKFAAIVSLANGQGESIQLQELNNWLFHYCSFDPALQPDELERYQAANFYAAQFCSRLQMHSIESGSNEISYKELRRFYRKRHLDKLTECSSMLEITGP
jgi:hypothetical protein